MLALALPAWGAPRSASVSGVVQNSAGVGQLGAMVEILALRADAVPVVVYTDVRGHYTARDLAPGMYQLRVSAPAFLTTIREDVKLTAGTHLLLNVTLNTLFEAVQFLPGRRGPRNDEEGWKWTLRSTGNRPILRILGNGQPVLVAGASERSAKASLAFVAGAEANGFGSGTDAVTRFTLERSVFSSGTFSFTGDLGYAGGSPAGVVRARYAHQLPDGSRPEIAITARRFATPLTAPREGALEAISVVVADTMSFADFLEVTAGGEFQSVQFMRSVSALRPFGTVDVHLGPNTLLEYRYAGSHPSLRAEKGFDSAPADLTEAGLRLSLAGDTPVLERARHHELSLSRRFGDTRLQVAAYSDRVHDAALLGVGDASGDTGELLPDVYSNTFTWHGGELNTTGVRVVVQQRFSEGLTGTVEYASGGAIVLARPVRDWDDVAGALHNERRHAVTMKFAGRLPRARTRWLASYRWTSGESLTPVDWFNASPGQADPYFNVFVRQPVPRAGFLPDNMELLLDLRNLLAQGYVPVMSRDGRKLYLVQAARSVRGGVSFNF